MKPKAYLIDSGAQISEYLGQNNTKLNILEILRILGNGGTIRSIKTKHKVKANVHSGKLESEELGCISSLPSIIFNNDIHWEEHTND